MYKLLTLFNFFFQIEALKAVGVTEVVLAINYRPEVSGKLFFPHIDIMNEIFYSKFTLKIFCDFLSRSCSIS